MNRQEKESVIESFKHNFADSRASFLVGYQGLTVAQTQELRSKLREQGGIIRVTKARLMKRAVEGAADTNALVPFLKGQVAFVFAHGEAAPVAKALDEFAKNNNALHIVVGLVDKAILDAKEIAFMASLPSREQLYAQLCGVLLAPVAALARVMNSIKEQTEEKA